MDKPNRGQVIEIDIGFTKVISVKLDLNTLREIDNAYRKHNFRSRSELIREALRVYLTLLKKVGRDRIYELIKEKEAF